MKDSLDEGKKLFPKFVREIKKYAPGLHELLPGASEKLVDLAEKKLKCKFPDIYRRFLKLWNGATLFNGDVMIYGIDDNKRGVEKDEFPVEGLVESNRPKQRWPGMPKTYLLVARTGYGDQICLDLASVTRGDVKVVQWSHEEGGTEMTHKKFSAWLDYEMMMGRGAYDFDGNPQ